MIFLINYFWWWPIVGLIIWGWFNYSVHATKKNDQKIIVRNSFKAAGLILSLLVGPICLVGAISAFLDYQNEDRKVSPKFGFKIW